MVLVSSVGGLLALMNENAPMMKVYALRKLDKLVDTFWHEIANTICDMEVLFEDECFPERKLVALVLSKVYYHLSAYDDALLFALGAQELFDVNMKNQYVTTVVTRAIDLYSAGKTESTDVLKPFEYRGLVSGLEGLVNRIFEGCFLRKEYKQIIGIALETRRQDMLHRALDETEDKQELTGYCLKAVIDYIQHRGFRNQVLMDMIQRLSASKDTDYGSICQALKYLEDADCVANIFFKLISTSEDSAALAYQLALDLYDTSPQLFTEGVQQELRTRVQKVIHLEPEVKIHNSALVVSVATSPMKPEVKDEAKGQVEKKEIQESPENAVLRKHYENLKKIISGDVQVELYLQFQMKNNHSDMLILKSIKECVRNSACHSATVIANALMHCGTTNDEFLRSNLEWVSKASNWAKFSAVASLGVIHKGHEAQAMRVLENYLPKDTSDASPSYLEGGGLYALGLIYANRCNSEIIEYLKGYLSIIGSVNVLRHGTSLALGLVALGTQRRDVYECLKVILYQDDAVSGEAAALAMGLVMAGSNSLDCVEDLISYAADTQHEKILRGLCVGLAVVACGRLEEPEPWISKLLMDKNALLRRAGVYALAMAYCGTGNSVTAGRLLNLSVTDVCEDVKRAAVSCLGFLMLKNPVDCAKLVAQLTESYNPHVRYGAAMALGIACAGTAEQEAVDLLEPMLDDAMNFVRQGALIALGMIYMQHNETMTPKVKEFRSALMKTIGDKHEDSMAKFGAILAHGILDAGGRNMAISVLMRNSNYVSTTSAIGLMVFLQSWYWFPLSFFISLAFHPTAVVGVNMKLQMPKMDFISNADSALYAYPAPMEEKRMKQMEKLPAVVLSFKAKKRERDSKAKQAAKEEEVEEPEDRHEETKTAVEISQAGAQLQMLANPARVLYPQLKVLSLPASCRYEPVKNLGYGGIIVLKDKEAGAAEDLVEIVKPAVEDDDANEPGAPEPFEYTD